MELTEAIRLGMKTRPIACYALRGLGWVQSFISSDPYELLSARQRRCRCEAKIAMDCHGSIPDGGTSVVRRSRYAARAHNQYYRARAKRSVGGFTIPTGLRCTNESKAYRPCLADTLAELALLRFRTEDISRKDVPRSCTCARSGSASSRRANTTQRRIQELVSVSRL